MYKTDSWGKKIISKKKERILSGKATGPEVDTGQGVSFGGLLHVWGMERVQVTDYLLSADHKTPS